MPALAPRRPRPGRRQRQPALPHTQRQTAVHPPPTSPAHPRRADTYLPWGVTFCSILSTGTRRCPQPKVRVASVPLPARPGITRGVGGRPLPSALQARPRGRAATRAAPSATSRKAPAAWRDSQTADSKKMAAASAQAGEQRGEGLFKREDDPRSQTQSPIQPAAGLQGFPLAAGVARNGRSPVSTSDGGG